MTKAFPRSVWTYVTLILPLSANLLSAASTVPGYRAAAVPTDSQRSGSQRRQADSLGWNFKLIPILAGRERATTRGDLVWLGLEPWALSSARLWCCHDARHPVSIGGEDTLKMIWTGRPRNAELPAGFRCPNKSTKLE